MELRPPPTTIMASKARWPWVVMGLQLLALCLLAWLVVRPPAKQSDSDRIIASKLKAAGVLGEAAKLYAQHLDAQPQRDEPGAKVAYSLGELHMELGDYESALRWLYDAELHGSPGTQKTAGAKIVHALESLGRVHAAKSALAARTTLGEEPARAPADAIVAEIGKRKIYRSDLQRAYDELPPQLAKQLGGGPDSEAFLQKYVADELLWDKAERLEYDDDPTVRQQLAMIFKQLVVGRFLEKEVVAKVEAHEPDLRNFYEAQKDHYREPAGPDKKPGRERKFEDVRSQVEKDYRMMRLSAAYQEMLGQALATDELKLFPEQLKAP